jgi:hypothetical protein
MKLISKEYVQEVLPELKSKWEFDTTPTWTKQGIKNGVPVFQYDHQKTVFKIIDYINNLEGDSRMNFLDVGCETALYGVSATQKFKKVFAIDFNTTSYKRALITKQFFWDKGYDVSNLFIKHVSFENYYKSGEFEKDGIEAILLSGCLATFNEENWAKEQEHNQVKILTKSLKNVKLFLFITSYHENVSNYLENKIGMNVEIKNFKNQQIVIGSR